MKYILILIFITVVQQQLPAEDSIIVIEINEFANFKEITQSHGPEVVKAVKKLKGSRTSLKYFNSSLDGTPLFPVYRNIKKTLSEKSDRSFIFISSHINIENNQFTAACADSKRGSLENFLKNSDFSSSPAIIVISTPDTISKSVEKVFINSFKRTNGVVFLTDKNPDADYYVQLFSRPVDEWKHSVLEKIKGGALITGSLATVSKNEINNLKKLCDEAKLAAEKANSARYASTLYTAATLKMRLLNKNDETDPVQSYFSWDEACRSFSACRAKALQEKYKLDAEQLHSTILEKYGHPSWKKLTELLNDTEEKFNRNDFEKAAENSLKAGKILNNIYVDVTSNLLELIHKSSDPNNESTRGLIKSLITLKPELKLNYAYPGQTITDSSGLKFVYIPSGKFIMGSPAEEFGHEGDEARHEVIITNGFYMSVCEITEQQWSRVMGLNYLSDQKISPTENTNSIGSNFPKRASWREAVKFCQKLSEKNRLVYRLPTEAEWEYAARAGSGTAYTTGNILTPEVAVTKESRKTDAPEQCGLTAPNAFGLYDMHGNLWEWCSDWSYIYENKSVTDPTGPTEKFARSEELDMKIVRGGSYDDPAVKARSANRWEYSPSVTSKIIGFRIILELKKQDKK